MNAINRRHFLKLVSSGVFFSSLLLSSHAETKENTSCFNECLEVFNQWQIQEQLTPLDYLISQGFHTKKVSLINQHDMEKKNIFEINGLVLGKSEAAFIAYICEVSLFDSEGSLEYL